VITLIGSVAARVRWPTLAPLPALLALAIATSGCGAAGHAAAATAAPRRTCADISAVLSDGPDPSADPVGYAEAQILPLRQIRTSDHTLAHAITALSAAYRNFFDSNGKSAAAKAAVAAAAKRVDSFCPGATS
jgi:uncharacterized heparinase superfamily protein